MKRDEYTEMKKTQLDEWNAKRGEWEAQMQQGQSNVKAHYEAQVDDLRKQRDEMMRRMSELHRSSDAAWTDMSQGVEQGWKALAESFDRAWAEFKTKNKQ